MFFVSKLSLNLFVGLFDQAPSSFLAVTLKVQNALELLLFWLSERWLVWQLVALVVRDKLGLDDS